MDLEQALSEVENGFTKATEIVEEKAFDIIVKNGQSGMKTSLFVTPANELRQVLMATASTIGINMKNGDKEFIFVNEDTAQSVTDSSITLGSFNVTENTIVSIIPDGKVAAQ